MSGGPGSDRPLDPGIVRAVIDAQFPAVGAGTPRFVGAGWDNEVYAVGSFFFRFPRRADVVPWHEREIVVTELARQALGELVPWFELQGEPCDAFPYPFVGYRPRPGVAAEPTPALAAELGRALGKLHATDPLLVPRTPDNWEDEDWKDWREGLMRDRDAVLARVPSPLRAAVVPYIEGAVPPPPGPPAVRFIYNDLGPDHVLVDPSTGALTGLIDFDDAMAGDPVIDFASVVGWGGYAFAEAMLDHYPLPTDPAFRDRLRWCARTLHLAWLVEDDHDIPKHQRWLARAFTA